MNTISNIGIFTSGGDAPGMNAAIRAVVRACEYYGKKAYGIKQGYKGMIDGDIEELGVRDVGNIIHRGGTILKTARSKRFRTPKGRKQASEQLKKIGIDAVVGIGGDGTFTGLHAFHQEWGMPTICIPGTIDNDLNGTDYTVGFDTAVNTAVEAIDKIRDTAISHNRLFFIEVMGRHSGYIALYSGIAGGAIATIIPEEDMTFEDLVDRLRESEKTNKKSSLIIVAEGSKLGSAMQLAQQFSERSDYFDSKVTILGHLQRGGTPTYFDRVLAGKMGVAAVEGLINGEQDKMVGILNNKMVYNTFESAVENKHNIDLEAIRINKILSI